MSALIVLGADGPKLAATDQRMFTPLSEWLAQTPSERAASVVLAPTDDPNTLRGLTDGLDIIAVDFPKPTDGRGLSIAALLRTGVGWRGELRAIGAVAHDQLSLMARCGFDAFALREGEDANACLRAFVEISVRYQGAVDDPRPLFRRRAEALAALAGGPA